MYKLLKLYTQETKTTTMNNETLLTQAFYGFFNALAQAAATELSKPETLTELGKIFSGCHDNVDVAQDALDAYQAGHLSKDQTLRIIQICLEERNPGKTIDIDALERLVVK